MKVSNKQLKNDIIAIIEKEELYCIKSIFAFYTKISRATFYNRKLDKLDSIKKAIDDNKRKTKKQMLDNWIKNDNPTLQISAYKLLSDEDERQRLSQTYQDNKIDGSLTVTVVRLKKPPIDER